MVVASWRFCLGWNNMPLMKRAQISVGQKLDNRQNWPGRCGEQKVSMLVSRHNRLQHFRNETTTLSPQLLVYQHRDFK